MTSLGLEDLRVSLGLEEMCGSLPAKTLHGVDDATTSAVRADVTLTEGFDKPSRADAGVREEIIRADVMGQPAADVVRAEVSADGDAKIVNEGACLDNVDKPKQTQQQRKSVWDRIDPKATPNEVNKKSFASVVGGVPEPELEFFPVKEEVDARVHIPIKLTKGMADTYRSVLLGYFLGPRFPFPVVLRAVQNAWGKFGFIDATVNAHGYFFFRFNGEGGCLQVIESSPLMIKGVPLFVTHWNPSKGLFKPIHTTCPLWVRFFNVPLVAFNKEGISRIASAIGVPLRMDACTASTCDRLWGRNNFAKVLVNVWAKGVLKREIEVVIPRLSGDGEDVVKVVVEYDWEPSQCSTCKTFGHTVSSCANRVVQKEVGRTKEHDQDGFQQPKRKFWRPRVKNGVPIVHQAESSTVKGKVSSEDTLVGVGSIKQVQVKEKNETAVQTIEQVSASTKKPRERVNDGGKQIGEAQYCTVNAGRTPVAKEGNGCNNLSPSTGPELVQSVVKAFKHKLLPKRGVANSSANSNRFSPLTSEETSDDEGVEIIDIPRPKDGKNTVLEPHVAQCGSKESEAAPPSLSQ